MRFFAGVTMMAAILVAGAALGQTLRAKASTDAWGQSVATFSDGSKMVTGRDVYGREVTTFTLGPRRDAAPAVTTKNSGFQLFYGNPFTPGLEQALVESGRKEEQAERMRQVRELGLEAQRLQLEKLAQERAEREQRKADRELVRQRDQRFDKDMLAAELARTAEMQRESAARVAAADAKGKREGGGAKAAPAKGAGSGEKAAPAPASAPARIVSAKADPERKGKTLLLDKDGKTVGSVGWSE